MEELKWNHISKHLKFKPTSFKGAWSVQCNDKAITNTGSEVNRIYSKSGISFSLSLSKGEYDKLYNSKFGNSRLQFQNLYSVYVPPHFRDLIEVCKLLKWVNDDKATWFYQGSMTERGGYPYRK